MRGTVVICEKLAVIALAMSGRLSTSARKIFYGPDIHAMQLAV